MNIRGFIKWQFGNFYKDLTFWGMITGIVAGVAAYLGCPKPIPLIMFWTGMAVIVFDLARAWFRFSYSLYRLEQNELLRKLGQKEQS